MPHYYSVGIKWLLCTCSDNLGKSNKFSSEFYGIIKWLIPGGNGGDVAGILLLLFITKLDKQDILPIQIKHSYYFHS